MIIYIISVEFETMISFHRCSHYAKIKKKKEDLEGHAKLGKLKIIHFNVKPQTKNCCIYTRLYKNI